MGIPSGMFPTHYLLLFSFRWLPLDEFSIFPLWTFINLQNPSSSLKLSVFIEADIGTATGFWRYSCRKFRWNQIKFFVHVCFVNHVLGFNVDPTQNVHHGNNIKIMYIHTHSFTKRVKLRWTRTGPTAPSTKLNFLRVKSEHSFRVFPVFRALCCGSLNWNIWQVTN